MKLKFKKIELFVHSHKVRKWINETRYTNPFYILSLFIIKPLSSLDFWAMLCQPVGQLQFGSPLVAGICLNRDGSMLIFIGPMPSPPSINFSARLYSKDRYLSSSSNLQSRAGWCQLYSLPQASLAAGRLLWFTGESWILTNPLSNVFCCINKWKGGREERKEKKKESLYFLLSQCSQQEMAQCRSTSSLFWVKERDDLFLSDWRVNHDPGKSLSPRAPCLKFGEFPLCHLSTFTLVPVSILIT